MQNPKKYVWKMIYKAKSHQPELQTIIQKESFLYTSVKSLLKNHNAAENGLKQLGAVSSVPEGKTQRWPR